MKISGSAILLLIAIGIVGFQFLQNKHLKNQVGDLQEELVFSTDSIVKLENGITAFKASLVLTAGLKKTLGAEISTLKKMNADLVAAASVLVRPTTVVRTKVDTIRIRDSAGVRMASIKDSTELGVLKALVTLPQPVDTIGFEYRFIPNPLSIDLTLARTKNNRAFFLAKYTGGETEVSASFADLIKPEPRFSWFIEAGWYINYGFAALAGAELRTLGPVYLTTFAEQRFVTNPYTNDTDPLRGFVGLKLRL